MASQEETEKLAQRKGIRSGRRSSVYIAKDNGEVEEIPVHHALNSSSHDTWSTEFEIRIAYKKEQLPRLAVRTSEWEDFEKALPDVVGMPQNKAVEDVMEKLLQDVEADDSAMDVRNKSLQDASEQLRKFKDKNVELEEKSRKSEARAREWAEIQREIEELDTEIEERLDAVEARLDGIGERSKSSTQALLAMALSFGISQEVIDEKLRQVDEIVKRIP